MGSAPVMRYRRPAPRRRSFLALAIVATVCCHGALAADAATFATVAHPALLERGDAVLGALPMQQPIHVEVALKLRNKPALDAFIASNAGNPLGGTAQPMASDRFLANHAPTARQAQAVADYLARMGFRNITIAPNRLLVSADGTALAAGNAFLTAFKQVRTHDGRIAFANTDAVRVPAALGDSVLAVLGLQTVHQAHTLVMRDRGSDGAHIHAATSHDPTDLPAIYLGTTSAAASDVNVGIVTQGSLAQTKADLATFASNHGLPAIVTTTVVTNGGSSDTSNTIEWNLDSQDIVAMAGQVKKLTFYNIPTLSNANLTADYNAIVSANAVKIANVSIGECETFAHGDGSAAADDAIFETAVAQGQTFVVATGDSGADECHDGHTTPSWPAASQYVVAAAGTKLNTDGTGAWQNEVVWNELANGHGASGGSPSLFEPMPGWQSDFGVAGDTRVVADVAFDGDPYSGVSLIVNGVGQCCYAGTSLSAPLFAGVWARMLQAYPTIGFAGPVIYALPATDFHDITSGNNAGETAAAGYDAASGRGSMKIDRSVTDAKHLGNQPPVANFSFAFSGLTVNFTDTSSDSDGNIASYHWDFGDGTTSTDANPSHTYAVDGLYSVSERVKDGAGASAVSVQSIAAGTVQLLGNSGFETGAEAPWTMSTPSMLYNSSAMAHSGNWGVLLGNVPTVGSTTILSQIVSIPTGKSSATLAFYLENCCESSDNRIPTTVAIFDAKSNAFLDVLLTVYFIPPNQYVMYSIDMAPYIGRKVKIRFLRYGSKHEAGSSWEIDDITLTVQ